MKKLFKRLISGLTVATIGASMLVLPLSVSAAPSIQGWNFGVAGASAALEIEAKNAYAGETAAKIVYNSAKKSGQVAKLSTSVNLEAGKTYSLGCYVHSTNSDTATLTIDASETGKFNLLPFGGTFNWALRKFSYTPAVTGAFTFAINVEGPSKGIIFDQAFCIDESTGKNLLENPSFDAEVVEDEGPKENPVLSGDVEKIYQAAITSEQISVADFQKITSIFKTLPAFKTDTITIDGDFSEWDKYPGISMPSFSTQYQIYDAAVTPDVMCDTKFAYDQENVYMYFDIKDDVFSGDKGASYWKGDSIQIAFTDADSAYGNETGFFVNPDTNEGEIYSSAISKTNLERMKIKAVRDEANIQYEVSIPWDVSVANQFGAANPNALSFCYIINDNDGAGRKYCAQIAPGISEGKTNAQFPALRQMTNDGEWYAFIEGPKKVFKDDDVSYDYYIVNYGEEKKVTVTNPDTGKTEEITVPAETVVRRNVKLEFERLGTQITTLNFDCGGDVIESMLVTEVQRVEETVEGAKTVVNDMTKMAAELEKLVKECEDMGLPCDYEKAAWITVQRFIQVVEDDIEEGDLERINYTINSVDAIYAEAKANLEDYISGVKTPIAVPKYVTSTMEFDGATILAETEDFYGNAEKRPVFFVGYMDSRETYNHYLYDELGWNALNLELYPRNIMVPVGGWSTQRYGGSDIQWIWTEDGVDNSHGLRVICEHDMQANVYSAFNQHVAIDPNKTYVLSGYSKGKVGNANIAAERWQSDEAIHRFSDSEDYQPFSVTYVPAAGKTSVTIKILCDEHSDLYIDELAFCEAGSDENLLKNGDFEKTLDPAVCEVDYECWDLKYLEERLGYAQENNLKIDLLLGTHVFNDDLIKEIDAQIDNGFIKFDVTNEKIKKIFADYIAAVVPIALQYESLGSIIITNEPAHFALNREELFLEDWHAYLQGIYGDIATLNKQYGTKYESFEEVDLQDPYQCEAKAYDYKRFNDDIMQEFHKFLFDECQKYAPDVPTGTKTTGYVTDQWNDDGVLHGVDIMRNNEYMTMNGCDAIAYYGFNTPGGRMRKMYWYEYMTSMKNMPIFNTEDHVFPDRGSNYKPAVDDFYYLDLVQGAVHGRAYNDIWRITDNAKKGSEGQGLLMYRPNAMYVTSEATLDLNRLSWEFASLVNDRREIGILFTEASQLGTNEEAMHASYEAYEAAVLNGKRAQVISEIHPETMHDCKLVIVPLVTHISDELVAELKTYVDNGGRVIVMGEESLSKDNRGNLRDATIPNYIKARSRVLPYKGTIGYMDTPSKAELNQVVREELKALGLYNIRLVDAKTGEPAAEIEANVGTYNGKLYVNLSNWSEDTRTVKVYLGDTLVTSSVERITEQPMGEDIELTRYGVRLLEIETDNVLVDTYGHWAEKDIATLKAGGVVAGVTETRYDPNENTKRSEFLALLARASGFGTADYQNNVPDVAADAWYAGTIAAAINAGIINAGEAFRPDEYITREEMCDLLVKCYEATKGALAADAELAYSDNGSISYTTAVKKATGAKLMYGRDDGTFAPKDLSTRAEAAAVVNRYMK